MRITFDIHNPEARKAIEWAAEVAAFGDIHEFSIVDFVNPEFLEKVQAGSADPEAETRAYIQAALLTVLTNPVSAAIL